MIKIASKNKQILAYAALVLIYVVFNLICMHFHERWRDEGTAWLIAKNATFSELWSVIKIEGHPLLWFLIVKLFATMGLSYANYGYLSLCVMTAAVIVLLQYKLPLAIKSGIIFTPVFSYCNAVMPRPYCVAVLLVAILGLWYEDRNKHIIGWGALIFLLTQTHSYLIGLALTLIVLEVWDFYDEKNQIMKRIAGIVVSLSGVILYVIEMWRGSVSSLPISGWGNFKENPLYFIADSVYKILVINLRIILDLTDNKILIYIAASVIFVFMLNILCNMVTSWKLCMKELVVFIGTIAYFYMVICFVYGGGHIQHIMLYLSLILFGLWILYNKGIFHISIRAVKMGWLSLGILIIVMLQLAWEDLTGIYSNGMETAQYLMENCSDATVVILDGSDYYSNVIAYTDDKVCFVRGIDGQEYRYKNRWEDITCDLSDSTVIGDNVYYLYSAPQEDESLKLIFEASGENKWNEKFYLYTLH